MTEVIQPFPNEVLPYDGGIEAADPQATRLVQGQIRIPGSCDPLKYTLEIPETLHSDAVALLPPGLGAIKRHSRALRHALAADYGIATISYGAVRRRGRDDSATERLFDPQKLHHDTIVGILEDIPANLAVKQAPHADTIRRAKIALAPHSMGGLPAYKFAAENPAAVDSVTMVSTVGSGGRLGLRLIARGVKEIAHDVLPAVVRGHFGYNALVAKEEVDYFMHDVLRTIGEIASCMRADAAPQVEQMYRAGTYQAFVGLMLDEFFKPVETEQHIGHMLNYAEVVPVTHIGPQIEVAPVAQAVGNIIVNKPEN